jgi:glycosyltransferase involved in cell wall biosynthesis
MQESRPILTGINFKIKEYKLEKNIKITGFISGDKLVNAFVDSSLYVLPSKSEAFGLVLLEAMHYGLPCIAFDSASGARNLLKDNIGILIKNRNINEMANKINELLNDKKTLKEYSNNSLNCVSNYSIDKIYKEWRRILK